MPAGRLLLLLLAAAGELAAQPDGDGCGLRRGPGPVLGAGGSRQAWPWMVALLKGRSGRHFCGGVLVSGQHVLTAAHCIAPFDPDSLVVRVGEYHLEHKNESRHKDYVLEKTFLHELYDNATYEHDIAVVKLRRSAHYSSYVWPICLPAGNGTYEGEAAFVTGWGSTSFGGPASPVLLQVSLPVWRQRACADRFTQPILDTHLCAGAPEGGRDSCQGDSGGPLMYYESDRWVTIGVVSWGIMCGNPQSPGIYTRVSMYRQWITDKIRM